LPDVGGKLEAWMIKIFHNFYFLQFDVVLGIVNFFSGIFDAISSEKTCPTSMLLLINLHLIQDTRVFPPTEF